MQIFLVRLNRNSELVGIFAAPSADRLWTFVDECCDPGECEFCELPPGSLYLPSAGAPTVPTAWDPEFEDGPDWFAGAVLSELWGPFFDKPEATWAPIPERDLLEQILDDGVE